MTINNCENFSNELEHDIKLKKELDEQSTDKSIEILFEQYYCLEELGTASKEVYDILYRQSNETKEYLANDEMIEITYMEEDYEEELFTSHKFKPEENVANEVKDKIKEIENEFTRRLRSMGKEFHYIVEPTFRIRLFRITMRPDLTANEFESKEI